MKPRTKLQKEIIKLSKELPDLTADQVEYAKEKLFEHKATLLKSGRLTCLDCGHKWQNKESESSPKILGVTCPNCKRKLKVMATRQKVFGQQSYYQVISTFKGCQVIRMFNIKKTFKAGQPQNFNYRPLYENWITKNGEVENMGLFITSKWMEIWGGSFELRGANTVTDYGISLKDKYIYPKKKVLPIIKRNGFKTSFHGVNPLTLCRELINNPKAETLFKAKQYSLTKEIQSQKIYMYWSSIKICLRNNYRIKDASIWFDYLELLRYFRKDLHNAKYVCPDDLNKEHDRLVEKKRIIQRKVDIKLQRKRIKKAQKEYFKSKKPFMGLSFSKGNIQVRFLNSVQEVMEEGDVLKHCVFTNKYHTKRTLLFSALMDGEKMATVEVDPLRMKVIQIRGQRNNPTKFDDKIKAVVNNHMNVIAERAGAKMNLKTAS